MKAVVWKLSDLARVIKERQLKEFDVNILVDGARGNGKSTFSWKLLTKVGGYIPEKDVMFTRDDVMEAIKTRKFRCIHADEMINSAHNRDFFSGDQKTFIKMMNMYRDNYNILVGAAPNFYDLDPQVRKLIKMRVTVVKRGVAVLQMARNSLYGNDPWETNINKKIEESFNSKTKNGKIIKPQYHKLTTYVGHIFFTGLRPDSEKKYKFLKNKKREEMNIGLDADKVRHYWEDANEFIETGKIKSFRELRFYLMGKGILYSKGLNKINTFRRDLGFQKTLKEMFGKEKKEEDTDDKPKVSMEEVIGVLPEGI